MKFTLINSTREIAKKNIWSAIRSITPPLGLVTLSAVLERGGHEADVLDADALKLSTEGILSRMDPRAEYVGLTATTPEINRIIAISRAVRERFPDMKVIFGGVHPTVFHDTLVADGACDMVVRGEGENAVLAIADGAPLEKTPNLTWRNSDGDVVVNPQSNEYVDLDSLPFPSYHKIPMDRYRSALGAAKRHPSIGIITSRGCPGKCTFCYSGMFGSRIRMMSPERVFEQITHLKEKYGIREISFYDDTFTVNRKRVESLCNLLISNRLNMRWSCFARVDSVSPDMLRLMKEAGCHQIMYGFESPSEEILKNINKRATLEKAENAIDWTRRAKLDIRGAFMLGNPGETEESLRQTLKFAKSVDMQYALFNITTPYPGTAMYDWAEKEGYLLHRNWDLYDVSHPVMELPSVSSGIVKEYYHKAYREFYRRPSYILGRLFSIRSVDNLMTNLKAFVGLAYTSLLRGES
jgi:radical SAM superfamily enzyme YgiQ (UPF0313 family)